MYISCIKIYIKNKFQIFTLINTHKAQCKINNNNKENFYVT